MMMMMTTLLPTSLCDNSRDHAAHTMYTTRILYHGIQNVPVAQCPGRHTPVTIQAPADPFAGITGAYDDRDL